MDVLHGLRCFAKIVKKDVLTKTAGFMHALSFHNVTLILIAEL